MANKSPAFQFYSKDWIADENVKFMTLAERGGYVSLLAHCWNEGTIPDDVPHLAKLCDTTESEMETVWPAIKKRFVKSRRSGRLTNKRLDLERKAQKRRRLECSEAGKKSARKRSEIRDMGNTRSIKVQRAIKRPLNSSSSPASSSSSATAIKNPPTPPLGGDDDVEKTAFRLTPPDPEPNPNGNANWRAKLFDEFWAVVWAKKGKGKAREKWGSRATDMSRARWLILKAKEQGPLIIAAALNRAKVGELPRPLHPAQWLSGERYDDDWAQAAPKTEEVDDDFFGRKARGEE